MSQATLLVSGLLSIAVGLVYLLVGRAAGHRDLPRDPRLAMRLFETWWFCIGGATSLLGVNTLLAAFGIAPLAYHVAFYYVLLAAVITGLFGLSYYFAYLRLGTRALMVPLALFHGALAVLFFYSVAVARPVGVTTGEWQTTLRYAGDAELGGSLAPVLVLVIVPSLVGAIAYFLTFFATRNVVARYRIGVVSLAIAAWFGSTLVASATGLISASWWPFATRLIGLLAALAILGAYRPPAAIRDRLAARERGGSI